MAVAGTEAGEEAIVAVGRTATSKNLNSPRSFKKKHRGERALRLVLLTRADEEVISVGHDASSSTDALGSFHTTSLAGNIRPWITTC